MGILRSKDTHAPAEPHMLVRPGSWAQTRFRFVSSGHRVYVARGGLVTTVLRAAVGSESSILRASGRVTSATPANDNLGARQIVGNRERYRCDSARQHHG